MASEEKQPKFQVLNMEEMKARYTAHVEKMKRDIVIDGKFLTINIAYEYPIELDRIDTPDKLLVWVHHLMEKDWMTTEHTRHLIEIVAEHFKMRLPFGC